MKTYTLNVQCIPEGEEKPACFIAEQGTRKPVTPTFPDLYSFYRWNIDTAAGWAEAHTETPWEMVRK